MEEGKGQPCEKKREFGDSYCIDLYINDSKGPGLALESGRL